MNNKNIGRIPSYNNYFRIFACQDPNYIENSGNGVNIKIFETLQEFITNKLNVSTNVFKISMSKFLDNSSKLAELEKNNTNSTKLEFIQNDKLDELKLILNKLHNNQYSSIREYQSQNYIDKKYSYYFNVFINTIMVFSLIFTFALFANLQYISIKTFQILFSIILVTYLIYLLLNERENTNRKKYDWDKFYFISRNIPKKI